jgi:hypothetical protein
MRLTNTQLRQIIKEELETTLNEMASFANVPDNYMLASDFDKSKLPNTPGVYFLFMDIIAMNKLDLSPWIDEDLSKCHKVNHSGKEYRLVYIGIAGEKNPLRSRVAGQHFGQSTNIKASTIRQTLGSIQTPPTFSPMDLSNFEKNNMMLSWQSTDSKKEALKIEDDYLKTCPFPLNLRGQGAMTSHLKPLGVLRKQLRQARNKSRGR